MTTPDGDSGILPPGGTRDARRSDTTDLLTALVKIGERLRVLEKAQEEHAEHADRRAKFNTDVGQLLAQLTATVESHASQLAEFREATAQIARVAQVLEGAYGGPGLVGQVSSFRDNVTSLDGRLTRVELSVSDLTKTVTAVGGRVDAMVSEVSGLNRRIDTVTATAGTRSHGSAAVEPKSGMVETVVPALVKVIVALCALLAAGVVGSKVLPQAPAHAETAKQAASP